MYPFVFSTFQWGLTAANIMLQFANVATDTLGGLSGQDSIVRASLTPLDASAGLLFLLATCNFVFDPARSSRWCLSRWGLLHSKDLTTRLKLSMRSSWLQITSTTKFVAVVKVLQLEPISDATLAAVESAWVKRTFMPNTSQFFVPYMRPAKLQTENGEIRLNPDAIRKAAALSIARYIKFLIWTSMILLVRTVSLWYYTPSWWQKGIILCAETTRYVMAVAQESSILTYSCQYKGVTTWGSPFKNETPSATGPQWDSIAQAQFRDWIWTNFGKHWHVKVIFRLAELCWPCLFCFWPRVLGGARIGPTMFAYFSSPPPAAFENDTGESPPIPMKLYVYEEKQNCKELCYSIFFPNVPAIISESMNVSLRGEIVYKSLMSLTLIPAVAGLFAPAILAMGHPLPAARVYWLLEQMVVNVTKYYDVWDYPINAKFDARWNTEGWILA